MLRVKGSGMKRTGHALIRLMEADGVEIPMSKEPIKRMPCIRRDHQQESPMWIQVVEGTFNCTVCGFSGNAYTYLREVRGMKSPRACRRILREGFGWRIERIKISELQYYQQKRAEQGMPPLLEHADPDRSRPWDVVARYEYRNLNGRLTNFIHRYAESPYRANSRKYEREFTPATAPLTEEIRGGFWLSDPLNGALPERDRVLERPLYRLPFRRGATIWVVSSEHAADALAEMAPELDFTTVCRTIPPAHLYDYDLQPLKGHDVWCIASQLQGSKASMKRLSERLRKELGCRTALVLPDGRGKVTIDQIIPAGWGAVRDWVYTKVVDTTIVD